MGTYNEHPTVPPFPLLSLLQAKALKLERLVARHIEIPELQPLFDGIAPFEHLKHVSLLIDNDECDLYDYPMMDYDDKFRLESLEVSGSVLPDLLNSFVDDGPHLRSLAFTVTREAFDLSRFPALSHAGITYSNARIVVRTLASSKSNSITSLQLRSSAALEYDESSYDKHNMIDGHMYDDSDDEGARNKARENRHAKEAKANSFERLLTFLPATLENLHIAFFSLAAEPPSPHHRPQGLEPFYRASGPQRRRLRADREACGRRRVRQGGVGSGTGVQEGVGGRLRFEGVDARESARALAGHDSEG